MAHTQDVFLCRFTYLLGKLETNKCLVLESAPLRYLEASILLLTSAGSLSLNAFSYTVFKSLSCLKSFESRIQILSFIKKK